MTDVTPQYVYGIQTKDNDNRWNFQLLYGTDDVFVGGYFFKDKETVEEIVNKQLKYYTDKHIRIVKYELKEINNG